MAPLDLCRDETSWGHQGWRQPRSCLCKHILNKPGICKGGQIVILSDVDSIRPHVCMQTHKLHPKLAGYMEGTNEVCMLMNQLENMVIWEKPEKKVKKIFTKKPAMCFDNDFSGDKPAEEAGERCFDLIFTTRHDHLLKVPAALGTHKSLYFAQSDLI
eukprot:15062590-Ditylum_brightwellii.AAC.1